ncbi:hypothetical protein ACJ6WF_01710 [Streptomyces sp. MMS24-I2-30]|uniref:hypothetical protein n=1 Tax=Streptomyces sp. MMS24-I2-30 TaxID=3351564 RepID=UPI00389685E3
MVRPSTTPPLSSVDRAHAGLAGGIDNAAVRPSGLIAMAALPLPGDTGPDTHHSGTSFDASYDQAMPLCAAVTGLGTVLGFVTQRGTATAGHRLHRRTHGWLTEPPLAPRLAHHLGNNP